MALKDMEILHHLSLDIGALYTTLKDFFSRVTLLTNPKLVSLGRLDVIKLDSSFEFFGDHGDMSR